MSTLAGFPRNTEYIETEGTVGRFRLALTGDCDKEEEDCAASFGMGFWATEGLPAHDDDRATSPPLIMLQPVPSTDGKQREYPKSGSSSSSAGLCERSDAWELGISVSDLSELAGSSKAMMPQDSKTPSPLNTTQPDAT
ncbi:hypothetical protein FRC01_007336 [Tulasnella sp. 417]|nr:hypothetical protein FRC01_007336 [Tulasnella sp. 417]